MTQGLPRDREVRDPDRKLVRDEDDIPRGGAVPRIRHRRPHPRDDVEVRFAPARHGRAREVAPVERVDQSAAHDAPLEDVGRLDDPLVDEGIESEQLREGFGRLPRALQRRAHEGPDGTPLGVHGLRRGPSHAPTRGAQREPRQPAVEDATGVVHLPMAHEMEAVGGHSPSLRAGSLWGG